MNESKKKIDLSIIIPVFNEEGGIGKALEDVYKDANTKSLKKILNSFEVIVVDDGSFDKTSQILKKIKKFDNFKVIRHTSNRGLGAAIRTGVKWAKKRYITYLPADGQAFLREITNGLKLAPKADLVLTYRGRRVDYNSYRNLLSFALMLSMKFLFSLNYKDYNWVHIYKRSLFKKIKVKSNGVFFLAEIIIRTHHAHLTISEAEAKYHPRNSGYSKNARISVVVKTLRDLFRLWFEHHL